MDKLASDFNTRDYIKLITTIKKLPRGYFKVNGVEFIKILIEATGYSGIKFEYWSDWEKYRLVFTNGEQIQIPEIDFGVNYILQFCSYFKFIPAYYNQYWQRVSEQGVTTDWIDKSFKKSDEKDGQICGNCTTANRIIKVEFIESVETGSAPVECFK